MLTLTLLRHAKSSWADPSQDDFDRPLNERGAQAAPRMGAFMARNKIAPGLVLCSTAVRTRQTLAHILPHLPATAEVSYEDGLYLATAIELLALVRRADATVSHLMLVGHDPGMHDLTTRLAGSGDPSLLAALAAKFPTSGLAMLAFDVQAWSDIAPGAGRLVLFMTPKRLP